jgi:hypothetical protein
MVSTIPSSTWTRPDPRTELARLFARAILRLHQRGSLSPDNLSEQSAHRLAVSPETSVTVVPTGLQRSSQRMGAKR